MEVSIFKDILIDYSRKIEECISDVFSPVSEKFGLTMMQTRILMELQHDTSHTIGSLANSTCVAGANISAMCKKLEALGLLERVRKREDERVVLVVLTELGQKTAAQIDEMFNDKISQYLASESEKTVEDIILGIQKLNEILQKVCEADNE